LELVGCRLPRILRIGSLGKPKVFLSVQIIAGAAKSSRGNHRVLIVPS
jgi:hypothetical protein